MTELIKEENHKPSIKHSLVVRVLPIQKMFRKRSNTAPD